MSHVTQNAHYMRYFCWGQLLVLVHLNKSDRKNSIFSHLHYFYSLGRGYLQNSIKMTELYFTPEGLSNLCWVIWKAFGEKKRSHLPFRTLCAYLFLQKYFPDVMNVVWKHEILEIQDGCVATHTAMYSVLPSKYTVILVLWLFFF